MSFGQNQPSLNQDLDDTIASTRSAFGVPSVSVAVVKDGATVYAKAFGQSDLARQKVANVETRYAVGSISKQFTAAALLLEQEKGKVSLDDKVSKYFPNLTRANEVSIRQLLSHTSGYEDYAPQDYLIASWVRPTTPDAILDKWANKPLNFDPGTQWQYSNTNYVLAGKILEKATGEALLPFLQQHFFQPLGMSSAGDCDVKSAEDASAYTRYALGPPRPVGREATGWYFAAGELCMTPSDLAKWDQAFLAKRILSPASYDEFTREVKLKNGKGTGYALGLQVGEFQGTTRISHSGEVSGFLAANNVFPEKHLAVVVLTNEDGVNLIGPLSREIAGLLINPDHAAADKQDREVRNILEGLQQGRIDRSTLTENASSYFSEIALADYRNSLEPFGKLEILSRQSDTLRGGMRHLSYRAHFDKNTVELNIYIMPNGKFEQFLVEEQF
ncbi:MAG: beta-lactamase family protein [Acidobacteriaceae bacterium]|nr:beta-lactamase family protein [Acidobacteriaceae bacterium]